jgi:hypothetical protein
VYKITKPHTAAGMQTFSIINVTLSEPETNTSHKQTASYMQCLNDTQGPPLFQLVTHPTFFWTSDTSVSFMAFLSNVDVAVLHNRHSLSMQYRCHVTKKNEECVQNILFVHQPSTEKNRLSFSRDLNGSETTTSYTGQPMQ